MGPGFTKTLRFTYENLEKEGYLIFTFDKEIPGHEMYKDYFPVVWRAVQLRKAERDAFRVTFKQQFLFATCQTQRGMVTTSSAISKPINFKESTDLTVDGEGFHWSDPKKTTTSENVLEAHNKTAEAQDISFCSEGASPSRLPEALLDFKHVASQATLKVEFMGQLRIYHDPSFQKEMSLECDTICPKFAKIAQSHPSEHIWDHALDEPGLAEDWIITYNNHSGNYEIKAAE